MSIPDLPTPSQPPATPKKKIVVSKATWFLTGAVLVLSVALIAVLLVMRSQPDAQRGIAPILNIAPKDPNSANWGVNFPNQYATLLKTETNDAATTYGGSNKRDHLARDPRLVTLFAGYGFSKEYTDDRGHMNALEDVRSTKRVDEKTPGTCYSCKSANNPELWEKMGMAEFDRMPFAELGKQLTQDIGCANCHEANTMRLIVTNPALEEAFQAQGLDWTKFTRQEMRSVVCANCHVEYYFKGDGKYLTFPWAKGRRIENIVDYYNEADFSDWKHPQSGTRMLKAQHPDFEMFTADSTHYNAGVACADCHMPYTREGAGKFSSHDVKSPLLNVDAACGQCHTDTEYVVQRVKIIQDNTWETMQRTEDALLAAIASIERAAQQSNVDNTKLEAARQMHRDAQMMWDFVAAENSMGFHNPTEVLRILSKSNDLARQAQLLAIEAAGGSPALQGSN